MSCRWAVLNQKGKTEEAKNLKLEIEEILREIGPGIRARIDQRARGRSGVDG
jgi:hypothetical protein